MTRKYGSRTLDQMMPSYRCRSCGGDVQSASLVTVAHSPYQDCPSLLLHATEIAIGWLRSPPASPACARCHSPTTLAFLDYHAYHAGADKDVVVRTSPPAGLLRRR